MSGVHKRYFEDIAAGDRVTTGEIAVSAGDIETYCRQFDPQPHHLDPAAAAETVLKEIVASGWHTTSITMKLLVEGEALGGAPIIGMGARELKWPRAVRPGDRLHVVAEVIETRASSGGRPFGTVTLQVRTLNQEGAPVLEMVTSLIMPTRPADGAEA
ncbi:MAG: MaoC/PaaZ C-terminal domain-containing protein [Azospirillaceae bacterium]